MKIGIDIDEVLAQYLPALIKHHNTKYNTSLKIEESMSYKFWETWGGSKEDAVQKVYDFSKTDEFQNLEPVAFSQQAVKKLKEKNELIIVTSRQEDISDITQKWVDKNFPNIFSGTYFANHYWEKGNSFTKKEICDTHGVEVFIEDSAEYAKECCHPNRQVFLIDYPWNRKQDLPKEINRVNSWKDIIKII